MDGWRRRGGLGGASPTTPEPSPECSSRGAGAAAGTGAAARLAWSPPSSFGARARAGARVLASPVAPASPGPLATGAGEGGASRGRPSPEPRSPEPGPPEPVPRPEPRRARRIGRRRAGPRRRRGGRRRRSPRWAPAGVPRGPRRGALWSSPPARRPDAPERWVVAAAGRAGVDDEAARRIAAVAVAAARGAVPRSAGRSAAWATRRARRALLVADRRWTPTWGAPVEPRAPVVTATAPSFSRPRRSAPAPPVPAASFCATRAVVRSCEAAAAAVTSGGGVRTVAAARRRVRARQQELAQRAVAAARARRRPPGAGPPGHRGGHRGPSAGASGSCASPPRACRTRSRVSTSASGSVPGGGHAFEELGVVAVRAAQDVQRAVRRDAVEPGRTSRISAPRRSDRHALTNAAWTTSSARSGARAPRVRRTWRSSGRR